MSADDKADILVVDDQPQKLLSYETILTPLGQNILRAGSGREALEILLKRDVAAILLDVVMPEMDGFELARIVRSHPRFERVPIIFVTALGTSEMERLRAYELGAVDYVNVPVVPEVLRAKVSVFVDLHRKTRALWALNRELERRVGERTEELERTAAALHQRATRLEHEVAERARLEAELRERAEKLAEADRLKNEFLAMLAHELRNPLAPVLNALEILRVPHADEPTKERARQMAERQVRHLTRLLDDLLDVSRITRGKIVLRMEPVLVQEAVEHVVEITRDLIRGRGHDLSLDLPQEPLWIEADRTRMEQILFNLVSNAAKFTEPGGRIDIGVERVGEQAVIHVRDSGVGISPDMLARVFDLFTQAARSLDRAEGGLGIGLTLVHQLVALHGGSVSAASPGPGRGSEFTVTLPSLAERRTDVAPSRSESAERGLSSRRILVVEDNAEVAASLTLLLQAMGHEVAMAHDGEAALRVASECRPEVVLLDIGLPGLDGYEVARRLRQDHTFEAVTLVALTGYVRDEDRRRSCSVGIDHHIAKPISRKTLEDLLVGLAPRTRPVS